MSNLDKFYYEGTLQFYPFKVFNVKNRLFIIVNTTNAIFEIDKDIEKVISCDGMAAFEVEETLQNQFESTSLLEVFEQLEHNNILKTASNIITGELSEKSMINSLTLMVCQECNLRCRYCYGEGGEYNDRGIMSLETGKKAIVFGLENCEKEILSIIFFGGEPLMQFQFIREWVHFAQEEAAKRSMQVCFSITTNATLITDEIADFFKANRFGVTISIDGIEKNNDKNRFYANGKGAYHNIIRGVHIIQNHGVNASARGTVTSNNKNMLMNWKHLYDMHFSNIHLAPAINLLENSDLDLYVAEEIKMIDYFMKCLKNYEYESISRMHNIESFMLRIHNGGRRNTCCGAQVRMIAVDKNGDIYPCHRFVSAKEMCIGNIDNGWNNHKMMLTHKELLLDNSECGNCWAKVLCGGGCPFENYTENAVICKPNSFTCKANQDILEYLVSKYLELSDNERECYFNQGKAKSMELEKGEVVV